MLSVTWFGTTCVLVSDGETALLVDPFITRTASFLSLAVGRRVLRPRADQYQRWIAPFAAPIRAMPVTHSHFDHILDAGVVGADTGAVLLGSASTVEVGRSLGLPAEQLVEIVPSVPLRYGAFTVTFLPSQHSGSGRPRGEVCAPVRLPARLRDLRQGGTYSVLVEHPDGNVLCHHSAGFVPGVLAGRRAGTVLLSAASPPTDLDAYLRETVDAVGARQALLVHWDDFTRPLDRPLRPIPFAVDLPRFTAGVRRLRPALVVDTLPLAQPRPLAHA